MSNMGKGSRFTDDYKKEMVRLVTELGKSPADVASDIGVSAKTETLVSPLPIGDPS